MAKDSGSEFQAECHPPGTAPKSTSYLPQPSGQVPAQSLHGLDNSELNGLNGPGALPPGVTSADVHKGFGHPGQGMTSQELHGGKRKKQGGEREIGSSLEDGIGSRKLDIGHEGRGKSSINYPRAEDREPAYPETVASER